jgi:hypothetical protein
LNSEGYLANDGHDLTFQTAFREGGTPEKPSVAMYMAKHPVGGAAWGGARAGLAPARSQGADGVACERGRCGSLMH